MSFQQLNILQKSEIWEADSCIRQYLILVKETEKKQLTVCATSITRKCYTICAYEKFLTISSTEDI